VTLELGRGVPSLRKRAALARLQRAFDEASELWRFRVVHYSIQSNHLHRLSEAESTRALSRGVQGLAARGSVPIRTAGRPGGRARGSCGSAGGGLAS
jgi:REP element-mobilizing transposase RayT